MLYISLRLATVYNHIICFYIKLFLYTHSPISFSSESSPSSLCTARNSGTGPFDLEAHREASMTASILYSNCVMFVVYATANCLSSSSIHMLQMFVYSLILVNILWTTLMMKPHASGYHCTYNCCSRTVSLAQKGFDKTQNLKSFR